MDVSDKGAGVWLRLAYRESQRACQPLRQRSLQEAP